MDRIQRESKAAAGVLYPAAAGLREIQAALRGEEALVSYELLPEGSVALLVTSKEARLVALPPPSAIETAAASLSSKVLNGDPTEAAAEALRKLVLDPLAPGPGTRRLLVSPDGVLSYVPFALLAGAREVVFVPSGTTYLSLRGEAAKRGEGVLALGDPDYGAKPDPSSLALLRSGRSPVPLPATRDEALAVGTVVLLGKEAGERRLREALGGRPRWRALHLACHGFVDTARPMLTSLALTPGEGEDGFLTVLDVLRLQVPADLVVLSACETGRGEVVRGEGILGLTRAFMVAGSPRVLVSLWKVDDQATRALMTRFYAAWKTGKPATAALAEAQASLRSQAEWAHPRFWAGWILWGLPD